MDVVTGAAGFIGSHLVDALLADGRNVVGIDNLAVGRLANLEAAGRNPRFRFVQGDINDSALLASAMKGAERVFHLGALADIVPSIERPIDYFRANVDGTFSVMEAARHAGVRRVVYAASSSCYGLATTFPTPETAPIQPEYPYALTKRLGEEIVLHWGQVYNIPAVTLRFFNVYGPRARTSGTYGAVFGVFLAQKLAGKPLTVVGDGAQTRDFTYVSDIVSALICAANSTVRNEAINIGSGNTYSIKRLTELLGGEVVHLPKRPGEPDCTFADTTKAERMLGWRASVSFEEGVSRMLAAIDDFKDAPVWTPESIHVATASWFSHLAGQKSPA
jgi:UDP-glucose 4-epimerase